MPPSGIIQFLMIIVIVTPLGASGDNLISQRQWRQLDQSAPVATTRSVSASGDNLISQRQWRQLDQSAPVATT
jgi:23S rRNA G2445 N2-methylase RlmL